MARILIMDEIDVVPGRSGEFQDLYERDYAQRARGRGMTLESAWQAPVDIPGREHRLYYIWSVPDEQAWWIARIADADEKRPGGAAPKALSRRGSDECLPISQR